MSNLTWTGKTRTCCCVMLSALSHGWLCHFWRFWAETGLFSSYFEMTLPTHRFCPKRPVNSSAASHQSHLPPKNLSFWFWVIHLENRTSDSWFQKNWGPWNVRWVPRWSVKGPPVLVLLQSLVQCNTGQRGIVTCTWSPMGTGLSEPEGLNPADWLDGSSLEVPSC